MRQGGGEGRMQGDSSKGMGAAYPSAAQLARFEGLNKRLRGLSARTSLALIASMLWHTDQKDAMQRDRLPC